MERRAHRLDFRSARGRLGPPAASCTSRSTPRNWNRAEPAPRARTDSETQAAAAAQRSGRRGVLMSACTAPPRLLKDVFSFHALIRFLVFQADLVHELRI